MPPVANNSKIATVPTDNQYVRETVESVIVAFILAFLFRAFVAEAFVIPTGSMAPTLMGAHKDLFCQECGVQYQVGASAEYDSKTASPNGNSVVGSTAAISRAINPINFKDANHSTFSGDRILVSKFDYVFSKPQRWDVLVFKYPGNASMNYIKRLTGLPNEQLLIQEGDIYVRKTDDQPWQIARKPAHKVLAMRQPVSDTNFLSKSLVALGYPSLWQPWSEQGTDNGWLVQQDQQGWSAKLPAQSQPAWLRYFHKDISEQEWLDILETKQLPKTTATDSNLVTDYLAYNSQHVVRGQVQMDERDLVQSDRSPVDGLHWVGDLMGEFEIDVQSDTGKLMLQLVELGVRYELTIDVSNGQASLQARDGTSSEQKVLEGFWGGQSNVVAATSIQGKGQHHVAIGNVDDQILVWVNHRQVKFNQPAEFDSWKVRDVNQRRPYWTKTDPLDAAPILIGGENLALQISRAQVFRDLYYIAARGGGRSEAIHEYGASLAEVQKEAAELVRANAGEVQSIQYIFAHPQLWEQTRLFGYRGKSFFNLEDKQYFPMGDNSAQSSDARIWNAERYVDEKFLLGKALLVFWPHPWYRPIPYLPNVRRMGLIR
jgi:signal peptidase I